MTMARSIPLEEGGSAAGDLITDECHGRGGDGLTVYLSGGIASYLFQAFCRNSWNEWRFKRRKLFRL